VGYRGLVPSAIEQANPKGTFQQGRSPHPIELNHHISWIVFVSRMWSQCRASFPLETLACPMTWQAAPRRGVSLQNLSRALQNRPRKTALEGQRVSGLVGPDSFWLAALWFTWADWGNLTKDCGREMYVPRVVAEGKVLYRDIWYPYGPAGPYFNALLFRIFGVHLAVLYIAGSLAALGSSIFLYLSGIEFSFPLAGWCAGAVVIVQPFVPTRFSFPVPYSFAAVYGCLVGCVFVWLLIRECRSPNRGRRLP
jgi:hypothetical protein